MLSVEDVLVLLGITAVVCLGWLTRAFTAPDPGLVDERIRLFDLAPTADVIRVIDRHRRRSRRYRGVFGCLGLALGAVFGVAWTHAVSAGFVSVAFDARSPGPAGDLVLMALTGWLVGMVAGETFHLRPRYRGPRVASLRPRPSRMYQPLLVTWVSRILAVSSVVVMPVIALVGVGGRPAETAALAAAALVIVALAEACRRAIALRAQPLASPELAAADNAIRAAAGRSTGLAASGVLVLLVRWQLQAASIGAVHSARLLYGSGTMATIVVAIVFAVAARRTIDGPSRRPGQRRRTVPATH